VQARAKEPDKNKAGRLMSATPYMKFYIGDYLGDTQHLTTMQHGAYMLLIMAYWQKKGPLPADDEKLARITRCTLAEWMQCKSDTLAFFEEREGMLYHHRIDKELGEVKEVSGKRRDAANRKWAKPEPIPCNSDANAKQMDSKSDANDMLSHIHSHSHIQIEEREREEPKDDFTTRFELIKSIWNDRQLKPPMKKTIFDLMQDERTAIAGTFRNYSNDEISIAMNNYALILASPEHCIENPYRGLVGFIRGGVEKFVQDADPWEAFKKQVPPWVKPDHGPLDDRPDATTPEQIARDNAAAAEDAMSSEEYEAGLEAIRKSFHPVASNAG
jgi:uncharacterized protein YdaU (DUF1376 family)